VWELELLPGMWELPTMTVVTDAKRRVTLRLAKPGDRFDVRVSGEGQFVLTRLEPVNPRPAKVRIEQRGPFHVGVLEHTLEESAIRRAIAEFP
jgi:hypothetical protein